MIGIPKALPLIAGIFAAMLAPSEPITPSAWAAKHLIIADGPRAGGRWDPALAPYVGPIIDLLGPDGSETFVAVRKSSQTGLTEGAIALCGSYIDRAPCRIGYAVQTSEALAEFNREKLAPTIRLTPVLKRKVAPIRSRSSVGSTEKTKRYPGGSLSLINGNSAADLKSRTLKVGVADEVDAWPDELGDDGDPLDLFKGRFIAFHATGDWRLLVPSTPTLLGVSRIDNVFKAGDQRFWNVPCPNCDELITLQFKHLKFNRRPPYAAHYVAQCCGRPIEHHEKPSLVRAGKFIATNAEGLYPSFHVDALISQVTTWDKIAETWWAAQGDEQKLKVFFNTWLGLPFEIKGNAPSYERLMTLREDDLKRRHIPPRGLLLVGSADVQGNGIYYEILALAPDRQSWQIDADFLPGDTTDSTGGAFALLDAVYQREYPDAFGGKRRVDAFGVDSGFRANTVYDWTRNRVNAMALKGMDGWSRPAISTAAPVDVDMGGTRIRAGAALWLVGTYSLKAVFYDDLKKKRAREGAEFEPAGACHYGTWADEIIFKQQTNEHVATEIVKGRGRRVWKEDGPNHYLDCRVQNMALADWLGLSRMTADEWAFLARERAKPLIDDGDLFAPRPIAIQAAADAGLTSSGQAALPPVPPDAPADPAPWISPRADWMRRT